MIDLNLLDDETKELLTHVAKNQNYRVSSVFLSEEFAKKGYKIALLGAGRHSEKLLGYAPQVLKESIAAIADNAKVGLNIGGFEVCDTDALVGTECDFVVMSSGANQKMMRKELLDIGICKTKIVDIYAHNNICDYLFLEQATDIKGIGALSAKLNNSKNPLLVISNSMTLGHLKLFKYLRNHYDLFVATSLGSIQSLSIDTSKDEFSNFYLFDSSVDLMSLASTVQKGKILTINGVYWNSLGACVQAVARVKVFSLFVDMLSSAHLDKKILNEVCDADMELLSERLLWEKSEGIVFKESMELASRNIEQFGPKKYLQFYDYCDDGVVLPHRKTEQKLSYVYAGGLVSPNTSDHALDIHSSIFDVARVLVENGCRFGIFNAYDNGSDASFDIYKNTVKSDLLTYSHAISPSQLAQKLCDYDIGIVLFDFSRGSGKYDAGYFKYGSFTKVIAYIEAELPIIISKEADAMASFVLENGIGEAIYWHEIDKLPQLLTPQKLEQYRQNVKKLKQKLSYREQIVKLVDFFEGSK